MSVFLAGLTFGVALACRRVAWPRVLTWLGLISYSVYLLHPALIQMYRHLPWTAHHSFWIQVLTDTLFLAVLLAFCSMTYLLVERPMQDLGRRLARQLDARFGPDRSPVRMRARTRNGARLPRGRIGRAAASWSHGSTVAHAGPARAARGAAAAAP